MLRHRDHREPRRAHQRLLRARDDHVDPPGVRLQRHGAERGDRVDDEGSLADGVLDRAHVGDDPRRRVRLLAEHEVDSGFANRRADLAGIGHLSPLEADRLHVEPVLLADRDPALPEGAMADDGDAVTRLAEIGDGRLHRTGAGCAEEQHVGVRAVDVLQARERARVDLAEVGAAVVHDRLGARSEHLGRDRRRAGCEEVALFHQCS